MTSDFSASALVSRSIRSPASVLLPSTPAATLGASCADGRAVLFTDDATSVESVSGGLDSTIKINFPFKNVINNLGASKNSTAAVTITSYANRIQIQIGNQQMQTNDQDKPLAMQNRYLCDSWKTNQRNTICNNLLRSKLRVSTAGQTLKKDLGIAFDNRMLLRSIKRMASNSFYFRAGMLIKTGNLGFRC